MKGSRSGLNDVMKDITTQSIQGSKLNAVMAATTLAKEYTQGMKDYTQVIHVHVYTMMERTDHAIYIETQSGLRQICVDTYISRKP